MKFLPHLIAGAFVCTIFSCSPQEQPAENKTDRPEDKTVAVESVSLSPSELTLTVGETASLTCSIQPSGATNQNVSWQSGDPAVATVDNKGSVQAIAGGSTVITVTTADGNKTSTCNLTVKEPVVAATGVRLDKEYLVMRLGEQYQLTATVMPDNATDKEVIWTSEHPEIVSVSSSGLLTANAYGLSHIIVKTADGNWSYGCSVYVEMPLDEAEVSLSSSTLSLTVGESTILRADIRGESQYTVWWLLSPDGIVKPSIDGTVPDPEVSVKLTAVQPGTVTVTCRVGDRFGTQKDYTCVVEVAEDPDRPLPQCDVEPVDLGLSVKWSPVNLGATKPEEYGDYFAWGDPETYYVSLDPLVWKEGKNGYTFYSYGLCMGSPSKLTKYCTDAYHGYAGLKDDKTVLEPIDDMAHAVFGGAWRVPTNEEMAELLDKCTWEWTAVNGVNGYKVTGPSGNSIFLPAAGQIHQALDIEDRGYYWSSSLSSDSIRAWFLNFTSDRVNRYVMERPIGCSVRPVSE